MRSSSSDLGVYESYSGVRLSSVEDANKTGMVAALKSQTGGIGIQLGE